MSPFRLGERERFSLVQSLVAGLFVGGPFLLVAIERHLFSVSWVALFFGHAIVLSLLEALGLPAYVRAQAVGPAVPPRTAARFFVDVRRVFGAALVVRAMTVVGAVLGASLPVVWMLATHRSHDVAIGVGALAGLFAATTITTYVTRLALLESLGPIAAFRRSLVLTRTRPLATIATGIMVWGCYWLTLAGVRHLALFLGLAILVRWLRDVWSTTRVAPSSLLSSFISQPSPPSSSSPWSAPHRGRPRRGALGALASITLFVMATLRSGDAGAQVALIADGEGAAANGAAVSPSTKALTEEDNKTELLEVQNKKLFDQANLALVEAQAASDRATEDLIRFRSSVVGAPFDKRPSSDQITAKDAELIAAADAADALVTQRKAALAEAKQRILDQANGGEFGSLQRNLVDIKNTGSFLKGVGSGTLTGVADAGRAIGSLAQTASAKLFGTTPPPVEPEGPQLSASETRLADNQRDLAVDLLRIRDGAAANELLGKGAGSEIIATVVIAEIGGAIVSRAGSALRASSSAESAGLLRNFGPGEAVATGSKFRGKTVQLADGRVGLGPETSLSGRGANLTTDNGLAVSAEGPFSVGVHSTANSLTFYADVSGAVTLTPRSVAVRMWKAGYRGGDVKLVACECALNQGLVNGLRKELNGLALDKPVGVISAPTATVDGTGALTAPGTWKVFN